MLTGRNTEEREKQKKLRVKNVTALLLAAAMIFATIKAIGGMDGILIASAMLGMPQGIKAALEYNDEGERQQQETLAQKQSSRKETDSSETTGDDNSKSEMEEKASQPDEKYKNSVPDEQTSEEDAVPEIDPDNAGTVVEKKYTASEGGIYIAHGNGLIKNSTKLSREKILNELEVPFEFEPFEADVAEPVVLIVHTHATESYERYGREKYDLSYTFRSTDINENMVSVGKVLLDTLCENGVPAIQATVLHDDPSYNGSYDRSAETVKKYLELYPSIQFVLDIHRDAIELQKGRIVKAVADIDGKKAAQIMIISGCDDGTMNMPDYFSNLRFAAALQDKMETLFPGITRPIFFCYRKYNMDLSKGALLIEVGSHGNTLDEAKYSAELIGRALAELIAPENKTAGMTSKHVISGGTRELILFSKQPRKRFNHSGKV